MMDIDLRDVELLEGAVHDRRHVIARKLRTFAKNPAGRNYLARERQVDALQREEATLQKLTLKLADERSRLLQPILDSLMKGER